MNVVCPECAAINRVPDERMAQGPKCGRCGTRLLQGMVADLTENSFARYTGSNDLPVLVDFWAPWCGPCKMMAPVFVQVAGQMAGRALLAKVNTEQEQLLAQRFNIRSIPTLALFRKGHEVERISGAMDATTLRKWVENRL